MRRSVPIVQAVRGCADLLYIGEVAPNALARAHRGASTGLQPVALSLMQLYACARSPTLSYAALSASFALVRTDAC